MTRSALFWSERLVRRFPSAPDAAAAIAMVGDLLVRARAATPEHVDAVMVREGRYPTGLPAEEPFALAHTDAAGALRLAAAVGIFDSPVPFRRMDDPDTLLPVRVVCVLCVPDRERQAELLSTLIQVLADATTMREIVSAPEEEAWRVLSLRTTPPALAAAG